jgi:mxaJ protein
MRFLAIVFAVVATAGCTARRASATQPLRVCSDPNNLPFSNERREGFENQLAELIARDFGTAVQHTWWAQRRGFIRNTLGAGLCDVIIGLPAGMEGVLTTRPYYRSTFVFVTRRSSQLRVRSFDDVALKRVRVGVQLIGDDGASTPPAHALSRRGIVANVRGYSVYGDYRSNSPPSQIITAVATGEVDIAAAWGPLAGYFAARHREPLDIVAVTPQRDGPFPFAFDLSMAVRRTDRVLLARLDTFIQRHQSVIARLLDEFHVPRLEAGS